MTERTKSRALMAGLVIGLAATVAVGAFLLGDYSLGSETDAARSLREADDVARDASADDGTGDDESIPGQDLSLPPTALLGEFTLAEEKQKYLWDIEHLAFVFGQDVVSQFKTALRTGELSGVERLLADDFQARIFDPDAGTRQRHGPVKYASWLEDDRRRTVDRDGFLDFLGSLYTQFESVEHIGVHVYYFSPVVPGELDGPWRIRWNGHTSGLMADGSRVTHRLDWQFDVASMREEMKQDEGWFTGFETLQARRVESPSALFEDVTAETGIDVRLFSDNWNLPEPPYPVVPGFARLLDFDRDGRTDVLMTDMHFLHLYRGLGDGTFENVTKVSGLDEVAILDLESFLTGGVVADLDDNGYPDLLLSLERKPGPDRPGHVVEVFRNLGGGTGDDWSGFEHVPESVHQLGERYQLMARGLAAADFDNDGLVDLFLGAVGREPPPNATARWVGDQSFREGALLLNLGDFRFVDVTVASGMTGEHIDISGSTWFDVEPDGDADLFLSNHMGHNVLWENLGDGTFEKRERTPGFGGFSMGATQGDLDGDGDADLYVANMYTSAGGRIIDNLSAEDYPEGIYELIRGFGTGNELYENHGSEPLEPLGVYADVANGGWAYGPELIDMDGDGLLDIYSPAGYQSVKRGEPDG